MNKFLRFTGLLLVLCLPFIPQGFAQVSQGGTPPSFENRAITTHIPEVEMPFTDEVLLRKEDALEEGKNEPPRFGFAHKVKLNHLDQGVWEELPGGDGLWRLGIHSTGAKSINLIFNHFYIPEGGKLFIYAADRSTVIGAFTSVNNKVSGKFSTIPIKGEALVLEYYEPAAVRGSGIISISKVVHGYRDIFAIARDFNDSGSCNNNVNCPIGADWVDQINSVAMSIVGGTRWCSGAIVNNTAGSDIPYYLTADHCLTADLSTWTFIFNYQSPGCTNVDGSLLDAISGATLRSSLGSSDFALMELTLPPPPAYNVYYAGWDKRNITSDTSIGIHHPAGDIKKISFDYGTTFSASFSGTPDSHWEVANWEDGTTEGGSSGSPLFNNEHRLIGQLSGGAASCSNIDYDQYGKFSYSWETGTSASQRLREWLDPAGTDPDFIDGAYYFEIDTLDAQLVSILSPEPILCDTVIAPSISIRNGGADTLTSLNINYSIDGVPQTPIAWTGSLPYFQSETVPFPSTAVTTGAHTLLIWLDSPNSGVDQDMINDTMTMEFSAVIGQTLVLDLLTDDFGGETTWELRDSLGAVIYSGEGYDDNTSYSVEMCVAEACYTFILYDDYGDGICCGYGTGSYSLTSGSGYVFVTGGAFDFEETTEICFTSEMPMAEISTIATDVCAGSSLSFNNISENSPSGTWTFPSGTPASSTDDEVFVSWTTPGTYTVTLIAGNINGNDTATTIVTVWSAPSIAVSSGDEVGGASNGWVAATVTGGTPPLTYNWSNGGTTDTVTGLSTGVYNITVTDANGCVDYGNAFVGSSVGIADALDFGRQVELFPNPNEGVFQLKISTQSEGAMTLRIVDLVGKEVARQTLGIIRSGDQVSIATPQLSAGLYQVILEDDRNRAVKKLMIE